MVVIMADKLGIMVVIMAEKVAMVVVIMAEDMGMDTVIMVEDMGMDTVIMVRMATIIMVGADITGGIIITADGHIETCSAMTHSG